MLSLRRVDGVAWIFATERQRNIENAFMGAARLTFLEDSFFFFRKLHGFASSTAHEIDRNIIF